MSAQSKLMDTGQQLRILLLSHEWPPLGGGAGAVCQSLCRELASQGHHFDVVTTGYKDLPDGARERGVTLHRLGCLRRRLDRPRTLELALYVVRAILCGRRLLQRDKYDLIHGNCIFPAGIAAYWLHRKHGLAYTLRASGTDVPGHSPDRFDLEHKLLLPLWRRVVTNAAGVVSPSKHLAERIGALVPDGKDQVTVIPNGMDPDEIQPRPEAREKRVLAVGRLLESKGYQYLIEAMSGLDTDYRLEIVGDGPYRGELERKAEQLAVDVKFHGWVDKVSGNLKELYETSKIFVHPSGVENFPNVVLEAMAAGLPVITTLGTGATEVGGNAVLLTPFGDVAQLRDALISLASQPSFGDELGQRARKRVLTTFSWQSISQEYRRMWDSAKSGG